MVNEEECVEEFTVVDRRLVLCTVACGFSAFALVYDYLFPFPRSEVVLAMCAIRYPPQHTPSHTLSTVPIEFSLTVCVHLFHSDGGAVPLLHLL